MYFRKSKMRMTFYRTGSGSSVIVGIRIKSPLSQDFKNSKIAITYVCVLVYIIVPTETMLFNIRTEFEFILSRKQQQQQRDIRVRIKSPLSPDIKFRLTPCNSIVFSEFKIFLFLYYKNCRIPKMLCVHPSGRRNDRNLIFIHNYIDGHLRGGCN